MSEQFTPTLIQGEIWAAMCVQVDLPKDASIGEYTDRITKILNDFDIAGDYVAGLVRETVSEKNDHIANLEEALRAYQKVNRIHNDLEAYLEQLGGWALRLGEEYADKPDPKDYGVAEIFAETNSAH